jgi:serine/threonine protein kinase/Flp pilus assembly protein TadD
MEGRSVLHYRIVEKIGAGGMGIVYKALDTKLKRATALKFLPPGLMTDEEYQQRFVREAMAASSLDHPNICTIYEINETEEGQLFIAMAYYAGETLRQLLQRGPLAQDRALDFATQLGRALECAHKRGVTHRDIKPANIMIHEGVVKVLDFGLAKLAGEVGLTQAGVTMGTPHYMSPEQVAGKDVDHRTDIWAAGAVLYEMLTGEPPFPGSGKQAILNAILTQSAPSAARRSTDVPPEADWIIAKALVKRVEDRYQQASEMIVDLEAVRGQREPVTATAQTRMPVGAIPAIAALPFENLSPDKENEYFSDGLTEELINALSQIRGLRVVSRTSVFEFKGKAQDIRKIGDLLKVDSVLEGSVRKAGNRIRIGVQLTDVASGYQVWSQRYDRELTDIFAVQDEISASIVEALKLTLTVHPGRSADAADRENNVEAYQFYLKGRFYWNKKTPEALAKAREFFEKALEEDPDYAPAYAGLADYHAVMAVYWLAPANEAWPKAKAAALKAIELDPRLADPHSVLGGVRGFYERNWPAAERELQKALELRPQFAQAHLYYCFYFMAIGRLDQALREAREALKIDPLSLGANSAEAIVLVYDGQHDAAIRRCREGMGLDPNFVEFHYALGLAHQRKGLLEEAVAAFERGAAVSGRMPLVLGWLGACHAAAGRRDEAQRIVDELLEKGEQGFPVPLPLAVVYTGLGDKDRAFEWLNRAADAHDCLLCYIQVVPTYDSLRHDPRYEALLARLGLLSVSATATMRVSS